MGGRLLPDLGLPAAQFMYEDAAGRRLTLYIRKETGLNNTSFQFAERTASARSTGSTARSPTRSPAGSAARS
jgi:anti-sigma factor RsiW